MKVFALCLLLLRSLRASADEPFELVAEPNDFDRRALVSLLLDFVSPRYTAEDAAAKPEPILNGWEKLRPAREAFETNRLGDKRTGGRKKTGEGSKDETFSPWMGKRNDPNPKGRGYQWNRLKRDKDGYQWDRLKRATDGYQWSRLKRDLGVSSKTWDQLVRGCQQNALRKLRRLQLKQQQGRQATDDK